MIVTLPEASQVSQVSHGVWHNNLRCDASVTDDTSSVTHRNRVCIPGLRLFLPRAVADCWMLCHQLSDTALTLSAMSHNGMRPLLVGCRAIQIPYDFERGGC
jgi:hypothetical protein